jgi:hypothetical protein
MSYISPHHDRAPEENNDRRNGSNQALRPWSVTERDGAYEVRDAAGLNLATVHFEDQPVRQSPLQRLSKDEARRVAAQIARLPTLLRIEKGIDPGEA